MMYYARYDASGKLIAIGTGPGGTKITEAEYNRLLSEIRDKAAIVNQLYNGEITIDDVPAEWQEEIQRRVDDCRGWEASIPEETEATEEDYLSALAELGVKDNDES